MKCPRCNTSTLEERVRDGVTIDVCFQCRGIWLDRGELERLIAREGQEYNDYYRDYERYRAATYARSQQHRGHKRPKTWIESLGDLFD